MYPNLYFSYLIEFLFKWIGKFRILRAKTFVNYMEIKKKDANFTEICVCVNVFILEKSSNLASNDDMKFLPGIPDIHCIWKVARKVHHVLRHLKRVIVSAVVVGIF